MYRPAILCLVLACPIGMHVFPLPAAEEASSASDQVQKSLQAWNELKAKCGGNYSYRVSFQSWVGFGHDTVIVVRDNKVVERKYSERTGRPAPFRLGEAAPKPEGESWTESGKELGTHPNGAPLKTLDELYQEAQKVADVKLAPEQRLYLAFDRQGLLQSCFYVDTRIADDAPRTGVTIAEITLVLPSR